MTLLRCLFLLVLFPTFLQADEPRKPLSAADTKKAFLKLLDRPKVDADVRPGSKQTTDGLLSESFTFASEKKADGTVERVPTLLVRPEKDGKYPVMIVLHGTGGTKDAMRSWLVDLAKRG